MTKNTHYTKKALTNFIQSIPSAMLNSEERGFFEERFEENYEP